MSRHKPNQSEQAASCWPHRLAWVLVCATFPLVLVGGTTATYQGGLRVIFGDPLVAKVHGCIAPLFFALCAALVTSTSRLWQQRATPQQHPAARRLHRLTLTVTLAIYVQIVLGVQLGHLPWDAESGWAVLWVWLKLIAAGLTAIGLVWLLIQVLRPSAVGSSVGDEPVIVFWTKLPCALYLVQLILGAGTWVTNYGWPKWFTRNVWALDYTIVAEGGLQVLTTTAHVGFGSLTLAASLSLTLWSFRRLRPTSAR